MQKLAGFSYVVRPFARSRRSLRYPATSSTHTILSTIKPKSYCSLLLKKRCKVVVARATYFISLKDVSFASKNQRSKDCGHSRDRTCGPFLRGEMLYPLSYVSMWGLVSWIASPVSATADKKKILSLPSRATF